MSKQIDAYQMIENNINIPESMKNMAKSTDRY